MAINAGKIKGNSSENGDMVAPVLEPGTYPARLVQVLGLGLQPQRAYKGEDKPPKNFIRVTYELLDEFMHDKEGNEIKDKPRWLSEDIPLNPITNDLANSTKRYLALDPKLEFGGDWAKILGKACMVTVVHNPNKKDPDKPYQNVASISTMRAKEEANAPELINPPKVFDPDEPDMVVFKSLPEWLQNKITEALDHTDTVLYKELNKGVKDEGEDHKETSDEEKEDW